MAKNPGPPVGQHGNGGSLLSIGSSGSILSIGSTGSILSIGSMFSFASVGSAFAAPRIAQLRGPRQPKGTGHE